ncbi:ferric iron uptake transcriptional regulator [Mesosutterella sp. AGMB02718]|uniref:Ferric uptake regulation protein n=1 Tax=Mesosutterella faecium TaxID=2925194 RepID=A0ABT7IL64_9BURK|nr:ferric iron uptake transcriptional regulator [Mesosutterella sp. AGMB02718]MDL2059096.1 ferric iron uptake transcriptional regulator [Mesosutterella sp. AGMB02718]
MSESDKRHDQLAELKQAGLKATGPRMKILEIFQRESQKGSRHMSADDIYKELLAENMDIGLATVYRVLTQFEAAGLLTRHHFGEDFATFELDDGYHHDHLVCTRCGAVEEFVDRDIEERQKEIAKRFGFRLESHSLSLYGICPACQKKEREKSGR